MLTWAGTKSTFSFEMLYGFVPPNLSQGANSMADLEACQGATWIRS
jgi:hypothetical protein